MAKLAYTLPGSEREVLTRCTSEAYSDNTHVSLSVTEESACTRLFPNY